MENISHNRYDKLKDDMNKMIILIIMAKIIFGRFFGFLCCLWPSLLAKNGGGGKKGQKVLNEMTQEQVRVGVVFTPLTLYIILKNKENCCRKFSLYL